MPTPPYAKILCSVNSGANQTGGVVAPSAATIALTGENTSQWGNQLWQIYDYPVDFAQPAGWQTDANGVYFSTAVAPPTFSLPARGVSTGWGKYMLRLTVNGGTMAQGLVDEATSVKMLAPSGQPGVGFNESVQFGGARAAWKAELQACLRALEAAIGGVPPTTTVSQKTANYTLVTGDRGSIIEFITNTGLIATMPASPAANDTYAVNAQTTGCSIGGNGHNIDGGATYNLAQYQTVTLVFDGSAWITA